MRKEKSENSMDETHCADSESSDNKVKLARLTLLVEKVFKQGTLSQRAILRGVLEELDDEIRRMRPVKKQKK